MQIWRSINLYHAAVFPKVRQCTAAFPLGLHSFVTFPSSQSTCPPAEFPSIHSPKPCIISFILTTRGAVYVGFCASNGFVVSFLIMNCSPELPSVFNAYKNCHAIRSCGAGRVQVSSAESGFIPSSCFSGTYPADQPHHRAAGERPVCRCNHSYLPHSRSGRTVHEYRNRRCRDSR